MTVHLSVEDDTKLRDKVSIGVLQRGSGRLSEIRGPHLVTWCLVRGNAHDLGIFDEVKPNRRIETKGVVREHLVL